MADEYPPYRLDRVGRVEDRVTELEKREAGREVKVEVATSAMNRLAALVGASGVAVLGSVIAFFFTGGHG